MSLTHRLHMLRCQQCVPFWEGRPLPLMIAMHESAQRAVCFDLSKDPQLEVNFYTGTDEDSDIAFQFRLHFGHPAIMNSRVFGIWRYEEKCYYVPFEDGKPFELCIYVRHKEYKVMVNGQRIYNFAHRFPPASVKMLQVLRDVSLTRVLISD
uniref:Galectin n=1 Tax=Colobus angolensis palliatus TaxID=336983 RepID=A0A2K5IJ13_COLAP